MRDLDHKDWMLKNWCFWTVVLEKTLESLLYYKEIKVVNPKGNQSWTFTERNDAEALILWPWAKSLKRTWCWQRLKARGEQDGRGRVGWMTSPTQWTWVWANSRRWWRTRKTWCVAVHEVAKRRTGLRDWTATTVYVKIYPHAQILQNKVLIFPHHFESEILPVSWNKRSCVLSC